MLVQKVSKIQPLSNAGILSTDYTVSPSEGEGGVQEFTFTFDVTGSDLDSAFEFGVEIREKEVEERQFASWILT
jgi:hypothetical protein